MAKLAELGLTNDKVGGDVDFDHLPKTGGFAPLLQPGSYSFQLPANLSDVWDKVESKKGPRITAAFDQDCPLVIVQSPGNTRNGEPFQTRISNVERARGKDKIEVSDMDYLLRALGHKAKPKTNLEYVQALQQYGGKTFKSSVELQWSCNPNKDIYVEDGQGQTSQVEGTPGCGARYYQKDIDKMADGSYPERVTCTGNNGACGASLRAFAQLSSIG